MSRPPHGEATVGGVTVVIPTFNEAESIGAVVAELPRDVVTRIVIVDGGSDDGTPERARAAGAEVIPVGRGYGLACLTGAQAADQPRQRDIETRAGARHLLLGVDVLSGPDEAEAGQRDHGHADGDEGEAGKICERLAVGAELPLRQLRCNGLEEQAEPLDDEAERHDRDRSADPGQEGPLIGGVVAVALDHRTARNVPVGVRLRL